MSESHLKDKPGANGDGEERCYSCDRKALYDLTHVGSSQRAASCQRQGDASRTFLGYCRVRCRIAPPDPGVRGRRKRTKLQGQREDVPFSFHPVWGGITVEQGAQGHPSRAHASAKWSPGSRGERFRGRGGGRRRQGRLRRDGAGVEWTRTRGQSVGDGGALAGRGARQEQHGGAGASPAGAAVRDTGGGRLSVPSSSPSRSAPRAWDLRRPGTGAWRQPVTTSGMGLWRSRGQFQLPPRRRVQQPGSAARSDPAGEQDLGKQGSYTRQFLGRK